MSSTADGPPANKGEVRFQRIGLFGGTFDPVHYGHLRIAEESRTQLGLDRVFFIPNRSPVHRNHCPVSPEHRFAMLVLATVDHPNFEVSRVEIDRPTPSYSVETVEAFHQWYPEAELFFITGSDEIADLDSWYQIDRILELCWFAVAPRPGFPVEVLKNHLKPSYLSRICFLAMTEVDIAATFVRQRLQEGKPIRYLTPPGVEAYILKMGLYRSEKLCKEK